MPLPLPRLDSRTFDQLVAEGQVQLPRHAPSWTDYNAHDPGITLLELLAWLVEMGFYRLDRTPAASFHAFLRLAGVEELRAAQVADTVVMATLVAPAVDARVPAGARVESADGVARFQAADDTSVCAARLVSVFAGRAGGLVDRSDDNLSGRASFDAFAPMPQVGDAVYLGFDGPLVPTPAPLGLFVSTGLQEQDRLMRARLQAEWGPDQSRVHYAVRVAWEYYTGSGRWAALDAVDDETRSLTLSGVVRFTMPASPPHVAGGVADGPANRFFLRCRIASGRYDCPPRVQAIRINALRVRHAVDEAPASVWVSDGHASQHISLPDRPIVPGSTRVTLDGAIDPAWREAPDWDRVGPHDLMYVVEHDRGTIQFGDGRVGRVPPFRANLQVTYQVGGGPSGNVPAGTLTHVSQRDDVAIVQPWDALGGEAAEDLDAAIGRALAAQATPGRAVTLRDFEDLTLGMPGVPIARAHAIVDYDPAMPCVRAPGHVTVVVVPRCPAARPEPGAALLRAVACYLERRRILTTQLHVVAPCFTTVSVRAHLHPSPDADARTVAAAARAALTRFFDPLRGGPDGSGWPVGRDVYRAEVMALLNDLPAVSYVDAVALTIGDGSVAWCGNGRVCPHGLVVSGTHQITIDSGSECQ